LVLRSGFAFCAAKVNATYLPYGAFEGGCPFHAKNTRTGCKKLHPIRGPLLRQREEALVRCKFWCVQALATSLDKSVRAIRL